MKEKSKSFFLLTGSIFVMAIGIYFSNLPTISHLEALQVLLF